MPQIPAEKSYFTFRGGLHSDSTPLNFPEEVTLDEQNFTLERDGSRRRRRGLAQETSGVTVDLDVSHAAFDTNDKVVNHYRWKNARGDSTVDYLILQVGQDLLFYTDGDPISAAGNLIQTLSFSGFASETSSTNATEDNVEEYPLSFAPVKGVLVCSSRYVNPFYLEWNGASAFEAKAITVKERDFVGLDDGIGVQDLPNDTDLNGTNDAYLAHYYNLRNRGWKDADITQYNTDTLTDWPAKNMIPWMGYRRVYAVSTYEADGDMTWDTDKLTKEVFGDASAPQGSLKIVPWAKTTGGTSGGSTVAITSWSTPDEGITTTWTVTATLSGNPGLAVNDTATISGNSFRYNWELGDHSGVYTKKLDGNWTVDAIAGAPPPYTITFEAGSYPRFDSWYSVDENGSTIDFGYVGNAGSAEPVATIPTAFQYETLERPQALGAYAGRIWYAGIETPELENKVYFSQIVEELGQIGKCYQELDPTSRDLNQLLATDGGAIIVPGMGLCRAIIEFSDQLLLFAVNGIWQISGGREGFSADNYTVRKISDVGVVSLYPPVKVDDSVMWASERGIFKLFQDPRTGFLTTQSVSQDKVDTFWDALSDNSRLGIKMAYDRYKHRVYILYQGDGNTAFPKKDEYNLALVYSTQLDAFYKLTFPVTTTAGAEESILHLFPVSAGTNANNNGNMKFVVHTGGFGNDVGANLIICDMNQSGYNDWDASQQSAFLITGYDNLQDFHRRKQAPVIHTFMNKTETGYTASGGDLVPVNESGLQMRAIWDWSDLNLNNNSDTVGHFGSQQQIYRHRRYYQPVDVNDTFDDGFPVVVSRNRVRGSGRVLHLRFDADTDKDAHLLGWSIHYKATRRV